MEDFSEVEACPKSDVMLTATQMQDGPPIDPLARVLTYSAAEWEKFIDEWVSCLKSEYWKVLRFTGSGDKGIDVAGFADDNLLEGIWDNYQCKHAPTPIAPAIAWPEIGKILWYSYSGHYKAPRAFYFVAPRGTSTTLTQLLANPSKLKANLRQVWPQSIREKITSTQSVLLEGSFAEYVDKFDFSIFRPRALRETLEQHRKSPYFIPRFGGGLPARPRPELPPFEIASNESRYISSLIEAYADHKKESIAQLADLRKWSNLEGHFNRSREAFYHAESLRVFVRDKVEPGTFENLQEEIYRGVIDTHDGPHPDGYQRVVAVTNVAQTLALDAHVLAPSIFVSDRHGICHQLANEDRLKWTR